MHFNTGARPEQAVLGLGALFFFFLGGGEGGGGVQPDSSGPKPTSFASSLLFSHHCQPDLPRRTAKQWHRLPKEFVELPSLETFNTKPWLAPHRWGRPAQSKELD